MSEKNDLSSAVASDDVVDCVEHLVEYLSCRVFGQAMYRHVTFTCLVILFTCTALTRLPLTWSLLRIFVPYGLLYSQRKPPQLPPPITFRANSRPRRRGYGIPIRPSARRILQGRTSQSRKSGKTGA